MNLNNLRDEIYEDAVAHGLWEDYDEHFKMREALSTFGVDINDLRRRDCGYRVRDESFELIEASNDAEAFSEELADVIIMSLSVAGKLGIDIDAAVRRKMEINKGRAWKHGKE